MKTFSCITVCLVLMLLTSTFAHAALIGPVYPAPGGNNYSTSGSGVGEPGGFTFTFTGFDPSNYGLLRWGPADYGSGYGWIDRFFV